MQIASLDNVKQLIRSTNNIEKNNNIFEEVLNSAMAMVNDTNSLQNKANQSSIDFAAGKIDSIHDVMIAQEKANISLQYTVEIRNKVLDAYNEIMRIQL